MSSGNLGAGSIVLSTDTSKLFAGLDAANKKLSGSVDEMKKKGDGTKGIFGHFKDSVKHQFSSIGKLFKGDFTGAAKSQFASLGSAMKGMKGIGLAAFGGLAVGLKTLGIGAVIGGAIAGFKLLEKGIEFVGETLGNMASKLVEATSLSRELGLSSETIQGLQYASEKTGKSVEELAGRFKAGDESVQGFIDEAQELGYILDEDKTKGVNQALGAFSKLKTTIEGLGKTFLAKLAPTIEMVADNAISFFNQLNPVIEFCADVIQGIADVAVPVFNLIFSLIKEAINYVKDWISEMSGVASESISVRETVIRVFQGIATAGAYAFDTIRAGIGVVVKALGYLVQGFSGLIDVFGELVGLLKELPDELVPDGLDEFINGVESARASVRGVAEDMKTWGRTQIDGFGNSAKKVQSFFDNIAANQVKNVKQLQKEMAQLENSKLTYKDVGAFQKGSSEALSILARFETEKAMADNRKAMDNKKLQAANAIRVAVNGVENAVKQLNFASF